MISDTFLLEQMTLEIFLTVQNNKRNAVICNIKKKKRSFPRIQNIETYNSNYIVVSYPSNYILDNVQKNRLKKRYELLPDVDSVALPNVINDLDENMSTKNFHFVFDVDSTLTTGRGTIQNMVRGIFRKMKESGHRIYLASGRSEPQLRQDMKDFNTECYGIAENGGILIGMGHDGHLLVGDRTEPDKVLLYMKQNCNTVKEDIDQGMRLTERIFTHTISTNRFLSYVRKSRARVDVLASKNAYHVTKKQINKGFALERLRTELRFGDNDKVVGVGDSDLDVPLFQESDYSFAVGNSSPNAKRAAKNHLGRNYADGVAEMYEKCFK